MVADDLGYTGTGVFGDEIDTPHLVALSFRGVENAGVQIGPAFRRRDCDYDGAVGTGKIAPETLYGILFHHQCHNRRSGLN